MTIVVTQNCSKFAFPDSLCRRICCLKRPETGGHVVGWLDPLLEDSDEASQDELNHEPCDRFHSTTSGAIVLHARMDHQAWNLDAIRPAGIR
jgi:hypothetical protein